MVIGLCTAKFVLPKLSVVSEENDRCVNIWCVRLTSEVGAGKDIIPELTAFHFQSKYQL